ncbi:MAG: ROK family protein [Actinomycetales bacterium]|nr:ROK family protein [Actinomycetales bacterium]
MITLTVDIGGSGVKYAAFDDTGASVGERRRIPTPYPCPPTRLVDLLAGIAAETPRADRATVGFPGLLRGGRVVHIPSLSRSRYDGPADPLLSHAWRGFPLAQEATRVLGVPTRVANDADVQGAAVVSGTGFEFVLTLGTGAGTALFDEGRLLHHLDLGHAPFREGMTFEEAIGDLGRARSGDEVWRRHVRWAIEAFDQFLFFDRIYIGGGNARLLEQTDLGPKATIVSNRAGLIGGLRLWQLDP